MALALALTLTGCGQIVPEIGSFREKIPEALIASNLGVTEAYARKTETNQNLTVSIMIWIALDRDSVVTGEVEKMLTMISPLIDQPFAEDLKFSIYGKDGPAYGKSLDLTKVVQDLNDKWFVLTGENPGTEDNGTFGYVSPGNKTTEVTVELSDLREYVRLLEKQ